MANWLIRLFVKDAADVKDPVVFARYGRLAGWVGIMCNLLLAGGKLAAGFFSGSIAVMADAVNNISDAASSVITLVGFRLAAKPADKEHPFGHARFEYISGLAVAVLVLVIGVELGRGSIDKIVHPTPVDYGWLTLAVLAASILLKLWMATFNRKIGRRIGSTTLEATFVDSRNDVITTSAVLVAALVARLTGLALDGWMGLGVAVFIVISGIGLIKDTLDPLLGAAPDPELVRRLRNSIASYPGVLGTHDLMVHDYGPGRRFASAHVEMDSQDNVLLSHEMIDTIERDVLAREGIHLIIHYDPIETGDSQTAGSRSWVAKQVAAIYPGLSIHDFRMVRGQRQSTYIFDLSVPASCEIPREELLRRVERAVQNGERPVRVKVTLDDSYAVVPQ